MCVQARALGWVFPPPRAAAKLNLPEPHAPPLRPQNRRFDFAPVDFSHVVRIDPARNQFLHLGFQVLHHRRDDPRRLRPIVGRPQAALDQCFQARFRFSHIRTLARSRRERRLSSRTPCYDPTVTASDLHAEALARWLAHGLTSQTHPVLLFALHAFFQPLGIEASYLEAEPFSGIESGTGNWWLHDPRWNAATVDRGRPFARDFGGLVGFADSFRIAVTPQGGMSITPTELVASDLAAQAYWETSEQGWLAARHSFEAARHTEIFLYAAAALLLNEPSIAQLYAQQDDAAFCSRILQHLSFAPTSQRDLPP